MSVEPTVDHPFFVLNNGWSSCSPQSTLQKYNLSVRQLQVGDFCVSLTKTPEKKQKKKYQQNIDKDELSMPPPASTNVPVSPTYSKLNQSNHESSGQSNQIADSRVGDNSAVQDNESNLNLSTTSNTEISSLSLMKRNQQSPVHKLDSDSVEPKVSEASGVLINAEVSSNNAHVQPMNLSSKSPNNSDDEVKDSQSCTSKIKTDVDTDNVNGNELAGKRESGSENREMKRNSPNKLSPVIWRPAVEESKEFNEQENQVEISAEAAGKASEDADNQDIIN